MTTRSETVQLNKSQRDAVAARDGPTLVLAGAGSGKTRVIIERLLWLIQERGIDERNLLALTFTNKAAGEMKGRLAERLGVERSACWVGTFHAFGAYVLRRDLDKLGRESAFTIFDDTDQLALMKRLVKGLPASHDKVTPRQALQWMSALKQKLDEPDDSAPCETGAEESYRVLWQRYHAALLQASAVDFDDLLVLVARLLDERPEVRAKYQRRFRHVLVDEYQDTNHAQYHIAKRLSEAHGNLFVVGDEDQSIYSWRGADVKNILGFGEDFPGARVFRLEQNYRSTTAILSVANAVVAHNQQRLGKTLWTAQDSGDPVRLYHAEDDQDEARFVVEEIATSGISPQKFALLYRTNAQARVLEEAFLRKGIPYVVVGGIRFYSRKEVKDMLCYLRLLVNPDDDEAVRRVVNVPRRGFGGVTMAQLEERTASHNVSLVQALREAGHDQGFTARIQHAATAFVSLIDDLAFQAKTSTVTEVVETLVDKTGYRKFVRESDEKDFRSRLEIVDEFLAACEQFDTDRSGGLEEFLQELSLVADIDQWDAGLPAATLMTCHNAKGLEFDYVFLVGLEEGLLPHFSAYESDREIEEERRLCYVAMTRARKRLTLTAAQSRTVYGESKERALSRFVREIPHDLLKRNRKDESASGPRGKPRATAKAEQITRGMRVRHPTFGAGYVVYTSGSGKNLKAQIRFETGRNAKFLISHTPLDIIEEKKR